MLICGIDPGAEGGVAFAAATQGGADAFPMPLAGKDLDGQRLAQWLRDYRPDRVYVEKVHSMPRQGVASTFRFGRGYGAILGVVQALGFPLFHVTPQAWKKVVLAGTEKDKAAAVEYCRNRWPDTPLVLPRCRVPHDGMADALCIAAYGAIQP